MKSSEDLLVLKGGSKPHTRRNSNQMTLLQRRPFEKQLRTDTCYNICPPPPPPPLSLSLSPSLPSSLPPTLSLSPLPPSLSLPPPFPPPPSLSLSSLSLPFYPSSFAHYPSFAYSKCVHMYIRASTQARVCVCV